MDPHYSSGVYNKLLPAGEHARSDHRKAVEVMADANCFYWNSDSSFDQGACEVESAAEDWGYSVAEVNSASNAVEVACVRPATCSLVNAVASGRDPLTVTGTRLPSGASAFWFGRNNGVVDVYGRLAGPAPGQYTFVNGAGMAGGYQRVVQIRNSVGQTICTSNAITTTLQ